MQYRNLRPPTPKIFQRLLWLAPYQLRATPCMCVLFSYLLFSHTMRYFAWAWNVKRDAKYDLMSKENLKRTLKVAQINYVSRNQLHCTANLNFGLMCKKAKHCWAFLSTNFSFLLSWYFFLIIICFLLYWRKNSKSSK